MYISVLYVYVCACVICVHICFVCVCVCVCVHRDVITDIAMVEILGDKWLES